MTIEKIREMKQYEQTKGCTVLHEQTQETCALPATEKSFKGHAICCTCVTTNATQLQNGTLHDYIITWLTSLST